MDVVTWLRCDATFRRRRKVFSKRGSTWRWKRSLSLDLPATVETLLTYLWTFPLISSFVVTFQLSISLVCC